MKDSKNGFTIIEVVLVLAVASLIFIVVFLAFPALSRSRRNTQRKTDVIRIIASQDNYYSINASYPWENSQVDDFDTNYLTPSEWNDPSTGPYDIQGVYEDVPNGHKLYPDIGQIYWKARHLCNPGSGGPGTDQISHDHAGFNSVVAWTQLENNIIYCIDNGSEN